MQLELLSIGGRTTQHHSGRPPRCFLVLRQHHNDNGLLVRKSGESWHGCHTLRSFSPWGLSAPGKKRCTNNSPSSHATPAQMISLFGSALLSLLCPIQLYITSAYRPCHFSSHQTAKQDVTQAQRAMVLDSTPGSHSDTTQHQACNFE